ncbi:YhgE/Pip domain-containing protein [Bifidobacterium reuteri]|uniref:YhgE/Pip domain-containing protein n=1 Tax=Bifidobacterium reuteri TaxID=983706 RepID=A0A5J5E7V7_9BIFI|nr:YhgE/Pip domain-containing protein [Bifidobacterium reuteri]KAA8825067.1 YhgE/Pip domain-containing protein [Bifidobacterium reuteri]
MRTIWRIYRRDLLRILRNPVAVVVTLGVAIIPSLYAWFNILANWDPYSATGNLQVAVANEDRGTSNELVGKLNAGDQVVSELKDNHQLGWRFVDSEDDAISGVETGRYYAAIVLPKNFSESLVNSVTGDSTGNSTGDSNSKHPQIRYYVNEKKNAIAPKITDTGATTIDEQINAAFIATVGDTVMSSISAAKGELDKAGDAAQQDSIADLNTVLTTLDNVDRSLTNLSAALKAADSTIADATATTDSLKQSIESARKASQQSGTLLAEAQQGSQAFSTTLVGALDTSSAQLSGIAVDVNTAAGTIIGSFNTAQNAVDSITNALNAPLDRTQAALDNVEDALRQAGFDENNSDPNVQQIWTQINALSNVISAQQSQVNDFHADASKFISSGKNATTGLSKAMGTAATGGLAALSQARQSLTGTVMPNLDASLNGFAALNGTLDGTLVSLNGTLDQANGLFKQLSGTISQTRSTVSGTQQSLTRLASDVRTVRTDLGALDSSAIYRNLTNTLHLNNEEFGTFMSQPVSLATKVVYPTDNYGSAVTPFYTNLALWVGGFVLIAIYKLEVDREHLRHVTATQAYLGRWLLLITVGFLQAIIACVGDLVLGIQCEHPALFLLAGIFCSFVYINIIYALAVAFRHIGKAVAVILVIVQIPGASGLYPIELMPDFFRDLHPWLPFTYGINAMRGPIAGTYANHYWLDMMHLSWYLPVALFVGLVVRRYAINLNALFDRRLGDTDLMITEHNSMINEQVSLTSVFGATSGSKDLRAFITRRAHRFFARYPRLITTGLVLLTVLPFVFLILLFVTRAKIAMLTAWILSIILIDAYLIVVEYIRESFARQIGISAMTADEFRDTMLNGYVWRRARHKHANSWAGAWGNANVTSDMNNTGSADNTHNAHNTDNTQSGGVR